MSKIIAKTTNSFDGTPIQYNVNKSKKEVIFFIHGLGLNHTVFKKEQNYFYNKGFSTVNMDLRGHGGDTNTNDYSLDAFSKDIYAILNCS